MTSTNNDTQAVLTTEQLAGVSPDDAAGTQAVTDRGTTLTDRDVTAAERDTTADRVPEQADRVPERADRVPERADRVPEQQAAEQQPVPLLAAEELESMLQHWHEIQGEFVDEPRQAINDADALVADLMQRLARTFAEERKQLETQLTGDADVSTEDLRQGLRRYRSFFERLLAA